MPGLRCRGVVGVIDQPQCGLVHGARQMRGQGVQQIVRNPQFCQGVAQVTAGVLRVAPSSLLPADQGRCVDQQNLDDSGCGDGIEKGVAACP